MIDDINKIRRAINLCILFTRNMAYYRASYDDSRYIAGNNDFSITISGNFIDISIIEWCKLFGAYGDNHHWRNLIGDDADDFSSSLHEHLSMSESDFKEYHQSMKNYRDVFATHWDDDGESKRPYLDSAFECVVFLHKYIFTNFEKSSALQDKVRDLRDYYETCYKEARKCYQEIS